MESGRFGITSELPEVSLNVPSWTLQAWGKFLSLGFFTLEAWQGGGKGESIPDAESTRGAPMVSVPEGNDCPVHETDKENLT